MFFRKVYNGIDHLQCSFSQKMQMLQLCIDARQKRHRMLDSAHSANNSGKFQTPLVQKLEI